MKFLKPSNAAAYLGLLYISIFMLQTARTMYLDAYGKQDSHLDLLGYAINTGIGALLTIYALQKRLLLFAPLTVLGIFFIFLIINVVFNTDESLKSVLLSRYGMLTWLSIGLWMAVGIRSIRTVLEAGGSRRLQKTATSIIYLSFLPVAWIIQKYLSDRVVFVSYQAIASNAIILICISIIALHAFIKNKSMNAVSSNLPVYFCIAMSSFLVYAVALMQSTGIVAFWIVSLPVILVSVTSRSRLLIRLTIVFLMLVLIYWISVEFFVADILANTRLKNLNDGLSSVDSLQTRTELLPGFFRQFQIAPVFGDYHAEVSAGFKKGEYIHSLPLSLLTHSGVAGFFLMLLSWLILYIDKIKSTVFTDSNNLLAFRLFLVISGLASIYVFFDWAPFWFFLGYMCVKAYRPGYIRG
ncbi:hypothetical protein ABLV49_05315 [Polaromonas hydrogenivorans]|uniref:O-antigen ligase domain-containing protein n=2 Tax=Polaromonas hydrogenivorans TaxID=335476 RepID=A0AAU7LU93_9BURK